MKHTFHIHINGIVQGVGFRPYVCRLAEEMGITGYVNNTVNGLFIEMNAYADQGRNFYNQLIFHPPQNAIISEHSIQLVNTKKYSGFTIQQSSNHEEPDMMITPDIAICPECKNELTSLSDKRSGYAFTTCLNCGPRYSIIEELPYDRENTTMADIVMCESCWNEYSNIHNRRHYSQTNSCADCAIKMHLYSNPETEYSCQQNEIPGIVSNACVAGKIVAVKGLGGYLLLCDATNAGTIQNLRTKKKRPSKPFALLYPTLAMASGDVVIRGFEAEELQSKAAPIVLCKMKQEPASGIIASGIAPGLTSIGLMLPYTPLLCMIADQFAKPLIATSGNISGSPIIYEDSEALENLFEVADMVLTYDRRIVTPQDDSVIRFTDGGRKIILRRSRGLAPNYFPHFFPKTRETILATGGELKSAFAIQHKNKVYVSQYLGDQATLESQQSYLHTLYHMSNLLKAKQGVVLIDKHPGYFVSQTGKELSKETYPGTAFAIQHHKAHFGAVLAENDLLRNHISVLGFIWDGTGYGEDGQIWGSESFIFLENIMTRVAHLEYFPQLLGDKMSREPRLSALSILKDFPSANRMIEKYFSIAEWQYYSKMIRQDQLILTSSMGRFLDALACILGICPVSSYEGEAVMLLESYATNCQEEIDINYPLPIENNTLHWPAFVKYFLADIELRKSKEYIARKIFFSLAVSIEEQANYFSIDRLAFSGGVFQNALLVDMIQNKVGKKIRAYFHRQVSPNDENIGLGQLACYQIANQSTIINEKETAVLEQNFITL